MKKVILSVVIIGLLGSCSGDFFDLIARTTADPQVSIPEPSFFDKYDGIQINWEKDPASDEYFLYRSASPGSGYSLIYQGTGTGYFDPKSVSLTEESFYFYKLAKRRGNMNFPISTYSIGTYGVQLRDPQGLNDKIDQALFLDRGREDVIYYFRDTSGQTRSDTDWFYVLVPKNTTYQFRLTYTGSQNPTSNPDIYLTYFEAGNSAPVTPGINFNLSITNMESTDQIRKFAFSYVPPSGVVAPNTFKIPYQLTFISIAP